jgi:hypothetical protein
MPSRRRTEIGVGSFGRWRDPHEHARETIRRIIARRLPLTEDAVFLLLMHQLKTIRNSTVFQKVKASKNTGGYRYFAFSPDVDLLEVTPEKKVIGYELKGERKRDGRIVPPPYYEGLDEALAYLLNPISTPVSRNFVGSILDEVWLVHPDSSNVENLSDLISRFTPLGLMKLTHQGVKIIVPAKTNPYFDHNVKTLFINNLERFETYLDYVVKPIQ